MALPKKPRLRKRADDLWAFAVKQDWNCQCAMCGRRDGVLDAHHIIPRRWERFRYNLANGLLLCFQCHKHDNDRGAHQNSLGFDSWLKETYPVRYEWCKTIQDTNEHHKFDGTKTKTYYLDVLGQLRQYVEPEEFERIVGVKLARHLDEDEPK